MRLSFSALQWRFSGTFGVFAVLALGALAASSLQARPRYRPSKPRSAARKKSAAPRVSGPAVLFLPDPIELGPGETDIMEVRLSNPSGHATVGTLKLSDNPDLTITGPEWDGALPTWGSKIYLHVKASPTAHLGTHTIHATYYVDGAGDFDANLRYRILTPVSAELVPDYEHGAVKVRVTNLLTTRTERGRVELRNADRLLQDQVSAILPPIAPGATQEVSIPIIKGGIAPGEKYRFDAMLQTWPGYRMVFFRSMVFYRAPR